MIERHWDNIVNYCNPENKVSPGVVAGINNKVRVIQRRAYGIKDRVYLKLKILTSFCQIYDFLPTQNLEDPFFFV